MRAVLFDLDGTLMDSGPAIVHSIQEGARILGWKLPSISKYRGLVFRELVHSEFPEINDKDAEKYMRTVRDVQLKMGSKWFKPMPGVLQTLRKLETRKQKLGMVTNRGGPTMKHVLSVSGLDKHFPKKFVMHGGNGLAPKPDPASVNEVLKRMAVEPSEALMVGDHSYDILAGRRAGVRTVALLNHETSNSELLAEKPDYTIRDIREVLKIVDGPEGI